MQRGNYFSAYQYSEKLRYVEERLRNFKSSLKKEEEGNVTLNKEINEFEAMHDIIQKGLDGAMMIVDQSLNQDKDADYVFVMVPKAIDLKNKALVESGDIQLDAAGNYFSAYQYSEKLRYVEERLRNFKSSLKKEEEGNVALNKEINEFEAMHDIIQKGLDGAMMIVDQNLMQENVKQEEIIKVNGAEMNEEDYGKYSNVTEKK
eukprot:CAMPEP_0202977590 /NCGR_PEP_ID=MMETSP1396-20130829/84335_1 /ASSEMBLY_ACC=CAM_ASM_000872 /TAXON_ID= /ORGANISM="Pseudokeronopsis sp., Strain Brazil" /LENGTH=203 /DNA_ID=CAMNT_0049716359 /DNA_START=1506 /DNA_END=2118 /DNA_ORIENTATION=+